MIRRHPVASYFGLAFLISWGGIFAVIGGGPIPAPVDEAQRLFVRVYLAMLAGPSVAGIVVTAVTGGFAEFRSRLMTWRVESRWYAVALFTAPVTLLATLLMLMPLSTEFVPGFIAGGADGPVSATGRGMLLLMGLAVGAGAGVFEEIGWTGVALPRLRARFGVVTSGLILGIVWGAWHFLAIFWGGAGDFGAVPVPVYLAVALFAFLPPYRILMAHVYDKTKSLFVAILMHTSLTASMLIIGPAVAGGAVMAFDIVSALLLWLVVGVTLGAWRLPVRRVQGSRAV